MSLPFFLFFDETSKCPPHLRMRETPAPSGDTSKGGAVSDMEGTFSSELQHTRTKG